MTNNSYRVYVDGRMHQVIGLFWNKPGVITEVRYLRVVRDNVEIVGIKSPDPSIIMQSTGFTDSNGKTVFEGDIVELDYQYGKPVCLVEWCPIKFALVLKPINGERPKHKPHFRVAGKKKVEVIGNRFGCGNNL